MKKRIGAVLACILALVFFCAIWGGCQEKTPREPAVMPTFIAASEAIGLCRKTPVDSTPWQILYADTHYVFLTYISGSECILRYNITENTIDRALDIRYIHKEPINSFSTNTFFVLGGVPVYTILCTTYPISSALPTIECKVDFENQRFSFPAANDATTVKPMATAATTEGFIPPTDTTATRAYQEKLAASPSLPTLDGWNTVAQLDKDIFFLIRPNDPETISTDEYDDFEFIIIDTAQSEIIQTYRFDSAE